jgi:AcrR family transcriptional regulator
VAARCTRLPLVARVSAKVRREEILKATCREVVARGFGSTRVSDVADALGISTGLVFYHFASKDNLLSEAFRYAAQTDLEQLAAIVRGRDAALERLDRIFRLYSPGRSSEAWALWIDAWSQALRSPALQRVSRALDLQWKETVAGVIDDGVIAGECSCPDPSATAWRLTALLDGLAVQVTVHHGVLSQRELLEWVRIAAAGELGLDPDGARDGLARARRVAGSGQDRPRQPEATQRAPASREPFSAGQAGAGGGAGPLAGHAESA